MAGRAGQRLSTIDLFDSTSTLLTGACGGGWQAAAGAVPADLPFQLLSVGGEISNPTGQLVERYWPAVEPF
jgi:hypothetical protein